MVAETTTVPSEDALIDLARTSVSDCNWTVGECAAQWTVKYARGRTDGDFGVLIGMSGDQVYQRRRVWETFGDVRAEYGKLRWSHFYVALTWDDAPECFAWAAEHKATVAEMRAWRRLQHGEDLSQPAEDEAPPWEEEAAVTFVPSELTEVRDPGESDGGPTTSESGAPGRPSTERDPVAMGVARGSEPGSPETSAGETTRTAVVEKPDVSTEQVVSRMTSAVERVNKALTNELIDALPDLPKKVRNRFVKAVGELSAKVAKLL